MACEFVAAWFHYANNSAGQPVPGGLWKLGLIIPAAGEPLGQLNLEGVGPSGQDIGSDGHSIFFNQRIGNPASVAQIIVDEIGASDTALVDIQLLAQAFLSSDAAIFNAVQGAADHYWIGCDDTGPATTPVCGPGTYYDPISESCKPLGTGQIPQIPIPPIPICPTGTHWDPNTETCKPDSTQPPPPPPPPPPPDPNDEDEITRCCRETQVNLIQIQQEIQQLHLSITGNGQPLDPVTCSQLTGLLTTVTIALKQIANAIAQAASSAGGAPVDLTPITTALAYVATALKAIADKPNPLDGPPTPDQPIDVSFAAFLKSTIDAWAADGTIDAGDAQTVV